MQVDGDEQQGTGAGMKDERATDALVSVVVSSLCAGTTTLTLSLIHI